MDNQKIQIISSTGSLLRPATRGIEPDKKPAPHLKLMLLDLELGFSEQKCHELVTQVINNEV